MGFALGTTWARMLIATAATCGAMLSGRPVPATAGAFNIPQGQGLAIFDFTFDGGDRYFNGLGRLAPADAFRRGDVSAYVEYGITDWLMAVVRPDLTIISLDGHPGGRYAGLGPAEAGAQWRLLAFGSAVLAVQGTFRLPGSTDRQDPALVGQTSHDADLRALFGYGFDVAGWPAFIDLQGAYRFRDADAPDEIHTDATVGIRPRPALQALLQVFDTTGIGRGAPWFPKQRYTHVELSGVYDLDAFWSLQLGVFTTVLARQSLRDQGLVTAVWRRF